MLYKIMVSYSNNINSVFNKLLRKLLEKINYLPKSISDEICQESIKKVARFEIAHDHLLSDNMGLEDALADIKMQVEQLEEELCLYKSQIPYLERELENTISLDVLFNKVKEAWLEAYFSKLNKTCYIESGEDYELYPDRFKTAVNNFLIQYANYLTDEDKIFITQKTGYVDNYKDFLVLF